MTKYFKFKLYIKCFDFVSRCNWLGCYKPLLTFSGCESVISRCESVISSCNSVITSCESVISVINLL